MDSLGSVVFSARPSARDSSDILLDVGFQRSCAGSPILATSEIRNFYVTCTHVALRVPEFGCNARRGIDQSPNCEINCVRLPIEEARGYGFHVDYDSLKSQTSFSLFRFLLSNSSACRWVKIVDGVRA